jgi:hypothetical protein
MPFERGGGRFKGIAVVANDIASHRHGSPRTKRGEAMGPASGMAGIAFNATFLGTTFYAQTHELLQKFADLGMLLQILWVSLSRRTCFPGYCQACSAGLAG